MPATKHRTGDRFCGYDWDKWALASSFKIEPAMREMPAG
jgi:hypothetical protein